MQTHRTKKSSSRIRGSRRFTLTYIDMFLLFCLKLIYRMRYLAIWYAVSMCICFFWGDINVCNQPTWGLLKQGKNSSDFVQSWKLPLFVFAKRVHHTCTLWNLIESWLSSEPEVTWNMFLYVPTTHTSCTSCLFSTLHFKFNKPFKMCGKLWGSRLPEEAQSKLVSGDIKVLKSLGL